MKPGIAFNLTRALLPAIGAVLLAVAAGGAARAQTLSPGVEDVGKLAAAGVPDETIFVYIRSSGNTFHLTPDDIIYLNSKGAGPHLIGFMSGQDQSSVSAPAPDPSVSSTPPAPIPMPSPAPMAEPPPTPLPPPANGSAAPSPNVNLNYFQNQLTPYGSWMNDPDYGTVWRPGAALVDPGWRPYCQGGHWVMTDAGWYWQADDPWGAVVFHYGRWFNHPGRGWLWVPGYNWAPSWVCWRHTSGYYGWAPLPPRAGFSAGLGLSFGGAAVGVNFDFGLGAGAFTFVGYDHIWAHDYGMVMLPQARLGAVFGASVILNSYRMDHGRFVVEGFGRQHLFSRSGQAVEVVSLRKQVVVEHTTVVHNVTNVKNVNIRNKVVNVNNITNTRTVNNQGGGSTTGGRTANTGPGGNGPRNSGSANAGTGQSRASGNSTSSTGSRNPGNASTSTGTRSPASNPGSTPSSRPGTAATTTSGQSGYRTNPQTSTSAGGRQTPARTSTGSGNPTPGRSSTSSGRSSGPSSPAGSAGRSPSSTRASSPPAPKTP